MTGDAVTEVRAVDPALRYGEVGERWGNLLAPVGAFVVGDVFRFQGNVDSRVVRRVLPFPTDPAKRLVHYESVTR